MTVATIVDRCALEGDPHPREDHPTFGETATLRRVSTVVNRPIKELSARRPSKLA